MSKWKILHGAGDVAVYNGLKKIFHVYPEEAEIVVKILNELEDEVEHSEVLRNALDRLLSNEVEHRRKLESVAAQLTIQRDEWVQNWNHLDKLYQSLQSELARCKEDGSTPPTPPKSAEWSEVCSCKEDNKFGSTWCCNHCGKPDPHSTPPRYVTEEEIDEMYNDDYSSMQFHISIQREAAKAMRDMIFGHRSA
ncbi:MAG: hypothetical protein ACK518_01815 [bacterium]